MPYLGTTAAITGFLLGLMLAVLGYMLMARALWPRWMGRTEARWTNNPWRCLFAGLFTAPVLIFIAAALLNAPFNPIKAVGFVITALTLGFALVGIGGLASRIGTGLASPRDEGREWVRTLKGGVALELSFLAPILGWFLILPTTIIGGVGAAVLAIFGPYPVKAEEPALERIVTESALSPTVAEPVS